MSIIRSIYELNKYETLVLIILVLALHIHIRISLKKKAHMYLSKGTMMFLSAQSLEFLN
jgi:hypothetical protein